MRVTIAIATMTMLVACAGSPPAPDPVTQCGEPRPQVCTMEYNPVCATLSEGGTKQYASPCNACADDAVSSYLADVCLSPFSGAASQQQ
jgi:hypothetical protein